MDISPTQSHKRTFRVGTHPGAFHNDEVFCIAVLSYIIPIEIVIVRSRSSEDLDGCDMLIDVGEVYDGERYFDHHMHDAPVRVDSVPYSSAGLFWHRYRKLFLDKVAGDDEALRQEVAQTIYRRFVDPIDHIDNGLDYPAGAPEFLSTIGRSYIPAWDEFDTESVDRAFGEACDFMGLMIDLEIRAAAKRVRNGAGEQMVADALLAMRRDPDLFRRKLVRLPHWLPYKRVLPASEAEFVVYQNAGGVFYLECVSVSNADSRTIKRPLPQRYAGLPRHELQKQTGIDDILFAHRSRFIAAFGTEESAFRYLDLTVPIRHP